MATSSMDLQSKKQPVGELPSKAYDWINLIEEEIDLLDDSGKAEEKEVFLACMQKIGAIVKEAVLWAKSQKP